MEKQTTEQEVEKEGKEGKEESVFAEKLKEVNKENVLVGGVFLVCAFVFGSIALCLGEWVVEYIMAAIFGIPPVVLAATSLR